MFNRQYGDPNISKLLHLVVERGSGGLSPVVYKRGAMGGPRPPSCDLMGAQTPQLCKFFWNLEHI